MAKYQQGFPVNENGEIVVSSGSGSSNIVGTLPTDVLPVDGVTGGLKLANVAMLAVNTIADLKALSAGQSSSVRVLGYYSAGDGAGDIFRWNSASTASDNGGTVIIPNSAPGTGRWERVYQSLDVKKFGAKGDGVTDDTAAIQAAADYTVKNKKTLIFPQGTYIINSGIVFGVMTNAVWQDCGDFAIEGYGAEIKAGPTIPYNALGYLLEIEKANNFSIQGLKLNGMAKNPPAGIVPAQVPVHNIQAYACSNFTIDDVISVEARGDGIYVGSRYGVASNSFQITNCNIISASRNGISIVSGLDFIVSNNVIVDSGKTAIPMPGGPFAGIDLEEDPSDSVEQGIVSNNVFKNNLGTGAVNYNGSNVIFNGNICYNNYGGIYVGAAAGQTTISSNQILSSATIGILCEYGTNFLLVEGNKVFDSKACGIFVNNSAAIIADNQIARSLCTASASVAYQADVDIASAIIVSNNCIMNGGGSGISALHVSNAQKCNDNFIDNSATTGGGIVASACQFVTGNLVKTAAAVGTDGSIILTSANNPINYKVVEHNYDDQATGTSKSNSRRVLANSAAPTSGTWKRGDIVYSNNPTAGGAIGWVCVTSGTPGTWKTFGAISV